MKITMDREVNLDGELKFTITVKQPHDIPFSNDLMIAVDTCKSQVESKPVPDEKLQNEILNFIHDLKEKTFFRLIENLKFSIKNELEFMFKHMCQEIYNWIYDYQDKPLRDWLHQFDPQRTKYYFHNDKNFDNHPTSNGISSDKIDDDDDED